VADYYECDYCGKKFERARKRELHQKKCGISKLGDFE